MNEGKVKLRQRRLWIWLPVAASLVVFLPGLTGQFVWDDEVLIQDNEALRDIRNLGAQLTVDFWSSSVQTIRSSGFYRPVVKAAYLLEYQLFGGRPIGFLAVNLFLHLACVALAFRFVWRRLGGGVGVELIAAGIAVLLFALHPAKPESVSWISGGTDLWMTFFVLCGFEFWERRSNSIYVALAALSFVFAFFCKETALCVPLILACDAFLVSPRQPKRIEFFKIGIVLVALGIGVFLHMQVVPNRFSANTDWSVVGLFERVSASTGLYVERAVWPWVASTQAGALPVDYANNFVIPKFHVWIGLLGILLFLGLLAFSIIRAELRQLASLVLHFVIPLGPVLNILPLKYRYLTADRFLYWPMIGLVAAGAWCVLKIAARPVRISAFVSFTLLALAWSVVTGAHVLHFHSGYDLWAYEYHLNSENQFVAETLARTLWAQDRSEDAMPIVERAVALSKSLGEVSRAAALYAAIALETTSDTDQQRLLAIREFLDQLVDDRYTRVTLNDGHVNVTVVPPPEVRWRITEGKGFDVQRAWAHLRTDDLEGANAQFRAILTRWPSRLNAWINAIQAQAAGEQWETADQLLVDAKSRFAAPNEDLQRLEAKLHQSRQRLSAAGTNEPERSLARAEALLDLGLPGKAQQIISSLQHRYPNDQQISLTLARIQAAIGR